MMIRLKSDETDLIGRWIFLNGRMEGDHVTERIETLVDQYLQKVTTDPTGWETLFRDPEDGRYWERTYPEGEMHGGGPPRLTHLSYEDAKAKYGDSIQSK